MPDHLDPGYYWILEDGKRIPAEWTGRNWWGIAMQRPYEPVEIVDPIPALPPTTPVPSQGTTP